MKKIYNLVLILMTIVSLSSCSEILDCIASTQPELESKTFSMGNLGTIYETSLKASVKNTSNDDYFNYYFSVDGTLPPGINYSANGRNLHFQGTPNQVGTYNFKVSVTIEYNEEDDIDGGFWEDNDRICFGNDTVSKNYIITIQ